MTDNQQPAVVVKDIIKTFKLPHDQHSGLKQLLVNFNKRKKGYELQEVLKGLSFEIKKGDFFGIVGRNGSGKSTLLKLLAGIYAPDSGLVQVNGSLTPFIELGVGFNPELTGRENVFLNGALLGFSRKEMEVMYNDIVEFAELEKFMDQKLKNYSSGMQVRLAFSIAIRADSDILLLDEVLAVGDEAFQRKCFSYFAQLKKAKKTVILVTHSMSSVQQFCNKALLIDKEYGVKQGNPAEIAQIYRELNNASEIEVNKKSSNDNVALNSRFKNNKDKLSFEFELRPSIKIDDCVVTFVIYKDNGEWVYRWSSDEKVDESIKLNNGINLKIELDNIFPNGQFGTLLSVKSIDRSRQYLDTKDAVVFEIVNIGNNSSDVYWKPNEKFFIENAIKK